MSDSLRHRLLVIIGITIFLLFLGLDDPKMYDDPSQNVEDIILVGDNFYVEDAICTQYGGEELIATKGDGKGNTSEWTCTNVPKGKP